MRIIQITPGAGAGFYCENCLRDAALARELRRRGHDVHMVPLYLPSIGEEPAADTPIFFGGINVYLQQKSALFRHTPRWLDRLLDARPLLRWAGRRAGMVRPGDLGPPTLSMLRGEEGRQVKELDRLADWLADQGRVDVVCLSNALLAGLVHRVKEALGGAPVVCTLQDEDAFLDNLAEPYRGQAWALLAERAAHIDAFMPVSRYYAGVMQSRLDLSAERVHVVHPGVETALYAPAAAPPDPPVVGYLGQEGRASGLDLAVEAFLEIRRRGRVPGVRLRVAGGRLGADEPFVRALADRIATAGATEAVEFLPIPGRHETPALLASMSVLSVPVRTAPAYALYLLEANAAGVPVVEPRTGALEELLEATGGGVLVEPENPAALADAIEALLLDGDRARALGRAGREAVLEHFAIERMADKVLDVLGALPRPPDENRSPS